MSDVVLWMPGSEMHVLIDFLNALHVGLRVFGDLELDRAAHFRRNLVKACLPAPYWFACAFRGKREVHRLPAVHLMDDAQHH